VVDRHEVVEQIDVRLGRGVGNHDPAPLHPSRTSNQPNPTRDSRSFCSTINVPHESSFNKAVSFGPVSFIPEATSLITATTDNPAAFANRVNRWV